MKILFITGSLNQGGAEFQILQLAKLFQDKEHEVEVFAITDYNFYKPLIEEYKLKYDHLFNHQSKIRRVLLTAKKIKKEKPEIMISYLKVPSQVALFAKIISGINSKLIIGERTSFIQPLYDKFHFTLMRLSDFITVNSITRLDQLKKDFPRLKNKIGFFPNIIDLDKFHFMEKNADPEIFKIGFVGRISPEKNVLNLIEAFKILFNDKSYLRLHIYGDTRNEDYLKKIKSLIVSYKLQDAVIFKGKYNNIIDAYQSIDLLCLISDYEGFSNVISEALSCGIPVITSNVEENRFLIENKINGFVVNHKDPDDIAKGINNYLKLDKGSKSKIAKANRLKSIRLFDKEVIYNNYMKIIKTLIAKNK